MVHAKTVRQYLDEGIFSQSDVDRCVLALLKDRWLTLAYTCPQGMGRAVEIQVDIELVSKDTVEALREVILDARPRHSNFRPSG